MERCPSGRGAAPSVPVVTYRKLRRVTILAGADRRYPHQMSSDGLQVRASDTGRAVAADALRAHCAAGRLEVVEREQRLAAALSARTVDEINVLLQDLPDESTSVPVYGPAAQDPSRTARGAQLLPIPRPGCQARSPASSWP